MAITVVGNTATASTSVVRLRLSVAVVHPTLSVSTVVPAANIAYVKLTLGTSLDTTGRFKFVTDAAVVVDSVAVSLDKLRADDFAPVDSHTFALAKPLSHVAYATDSLTRAVAKQLADSYGVSAAATLQVAKAAFDAYGFSDHSVFSVDKLVTDGVGMNDSFDTGDGSVYSFTKHISNVAFVNEQLRRDVAKSLTDSVVAGSLAALSVTKAPFTDAAQVADTIAAVTQLSKADAAAVMDSVAVLAAKLLVDAYTLADVMSHALVKAASDTVLTSESTAFATTKLVPMDYAPLADAAALAIDTPRSDAVAATDFIYVVLVLIRSFADSVSTADSQTFGTALGKSETILVASATVYAVDKALADGVGMNDLADVGDGVTFDFTQAVANVAFMADNSARHTQPSKAETVAMADSGSLVIQDYCDLTYFAEDYVGIARSF